MIPNIHIHGEPDTHPERHVHDAYELATGKIDLSKLNVKEHHVRVFDLMDPKQREEYENLYVDLSMLVKKGCVLVSANTRETLSRTDGSTGWFKYLEWTEYDTSEILGA